MRHNERCCWATKRISARGGARPLITTGLGVCCCCGVVLDQAVGCVRAARVARSRSPQLSIARADIQTVRTALLHTAAVACCSAVCRCAGIPPLGSSCRRPSTVALDQFNGNRVMLIRCLLTDIADVVPDVEA
eukprot:7378186-Prymnesium_polylepis.2